MVVAETLPVVGVAVADSGAGGGEAVGDDAVEIVRRSTLCVREEDRSYASIAVPQPDCESAEADEVAALEVEVVDWAAARLATARMRAAVYCMLIDLLVCDVLRETGA